MSDNWNGKTKPEIGQQMFFLDSNGKMRKAIVFGIYDCESDDTVIWHKAADGCYSDGREFSTDSICFFEPICSERDEMIDQLLSDAEDYACFMELNVAEKLIDLGWRKIKENN